MKGKFFYKIDYNTDNWKKQYRNSKVGKNYHNLEKSGLKPGKTGCFWHSSPTFVSISYENRALEYSGGNQSMTRNNKNR